MNAFDLPASVGNEIQELKRRIRVMESAARVPNISTGAAGIQATSVDSVSTPAIGFTYEPPSSGVAGPSVNVTVPLTGRLLVLMSFAAYIDPDVTGLTRVVSASFSMSGANVLAPSGDRAASGWIYGDASTPATLSTSILLSGLNRGTTTLTMGYRALDAAVKVKNRSLIVFPL